MKTKVTYSQVKQALLNGFVSPLNNSVMSASATLVKALQSFRDAAKPRIAAGHIDQLIAEQDVIAISKKAPKTAKQQNFFIGYLINEIRHRNNLAGSVSISEVA